MNVNTLWEESDVIKLEGCFKMMTLKTKLCYQTWYTVTTNELVTLNGTYYNLRHFYDDGAKIQS